MISSTQPTSHDRDSEGDAMQDRLLQSESVDWKQAYEAEAAKFQAETLRASRILDVLDHWRFIADQEWTSDPHKVLRDCIAEARSAGDHLAPYGPGHDSAACPWRSA